jgi:hypothetical protein
MSSTITVDFLEKCSKEDLDKLPVGYQNMITYQPAVMFLAKSQYRNTDQLVCHPPMKPISRLFLEEDF